MSEFEDIAEEMFDCISKTDYSGEYMDYFEERLEAARRDGTCKDVWDVELTGRLRFQCSECGAVSLEITPRFCPNCGRKVDE